MTGDVYVVQSFRASEIPIVIVSVELAAPIWIHCADLRKVLDASYFGFGSEYLMLGGGVDRTRIVRREKIHDGLDIPILSAEIVSCRCHSTTDSSCLRAHGTWVERDVSRWPVTWQRGRCRPE